jgi:hypothetical protein
LDAEYRYVIFNLDNLVWTKQIPANENYPQLRYGHTGVLYGKRYYIFGGRTQHYILLGDVEVYSLEDKSWSSPMLMTKNTLQLRKYHIAEVIGHHMLVHGGQNENNEYLNDTALLQLSPLKWHHAIINEDTPGPCLSGHACALVIPSEMKCNYKMNIYKYPEVTLSKTVAKVDNL